ncbi:uncharacterized protein LOC143191524 [Rhynchophorus ferrugineus]|uniref:J domain-containing protein n=1 Tax=Rhynchophorus ferrugineus TaxID=354439 RepID=A0A834MB35_RHYFE|nr:hypothetical protein GWI33_015778 [Rhynchophorus ferrugineus]
MNFYYSYVLRRSRGNIAKYLHSSGINYGNYYDILKLRRECTVKEIRESFIKLSKEHHPDINKSPEAHSEFLKIQEAYNVLSKPETRATYDFSLSNSASQNGPYHTVYSQRAYREATRQQSRNPWDDPFFYHNRDRTRDAEYEAKPYYGIKGIKKVSNGTVALLCIVAAIFSFCIQLMAVNYAQIKKKQQSDELGVILSEIRERANRNGNKVQVEILRRRFEEDERRKMGYTTSD